jgi:hypothetical protein
MSTSQVRPEPSVPRTPGQTEPGPNAGQTEPSARRAAGQTRPGPSARRAAGQTEPGPSARRAAGQTRSRRAERFLLSYTWIVIAWLLLPIAVMIVFGFNDTSSRFNIRWQGFTLRWYR